MTENTENTETAVAVVEEKPKTLHQYEVIVEKSGERGAKEWRKAAEALLAIKTHKLWKKAKDSDGRPYSTFIAYAEGRFGFRKSYAYDLAKAATSGALTEGAARKERAASREPGPLAAHEAALRVAKAWVRFCDAGGNLRDRTLDLDPKFAEDYDNALKIAGNAIDKLVGKYPAPIEHQPAEDANPENVSPTKPE
jgi:hypothetical protein